jgi:hypothetical protein
LQEWARLNRYHPIHGACLILRDRTIFRDHQLLYLITRDRPRILDGFGCPVIIMAIGGCQGTGQSLGGIEEDGKT